LQLLKPERMLLGVERRTILFGIGLTELLLIFVIALLFVGPKRLPGVARSIGRVWGQLSDMSRQFYDALTDAAKEQNADGPSVPDWLSDVAKPGSSIKVRPLGEDDDKT